MTMEAKHQGVSGKECVRGGCPPCRGPVELKEHAFEVADGRGWSIRVVSRRHRPSGRQQAHGEYNLDGQVADAASGASIWRVKAPEAK